MGLICPCVLIVGAVVVYFVVMCQCLYPIILCIISWCSGNTYEFQTKSTFKHFSQSYCAFILFPILVLLCSKKDMKIFMKAGSFGVVFLVFLLGFIIAIGIKALGNTTYVLGTTDESNLTDWNETQRVLVMFNVNFSPLAGILCTGYFLHTCSLSILRSSANPEKNTRDLFLGYVLVFISYSVVGFFGYIGFLGVNYKQFYITESTTTAAG
jgi:hypothetical protein